MGIIYVLRGQLSSVMRPLYSIAAKVVMVLGLFSFFTLLTRYNPLFNFYQAGETFLFNIWFFAFGTTIALWWLSTQFYFEKYRKYFAVLMALNVWFFVSLQIRDYWTDGSMMFARSDIASGEQYTYSLVWMLMAVAGFVLALFKQRKSIYKGSLYLLGVVIVKLFLVDMADLTGLLRVASFLGLGLSLLGMAFLYQYFDKRDWIADSSSTEAKN